LWRRERRQAALQEEAPREVQGDAFYFSVCLVVLKALKLGADQKNWEEKIFQIVEWRKIIFFIAKFLSEVLWKFSNV
jgi:hypothetical protein